MPELRTPSPSDLPALLLAFARRVAEAGGRAYVVGGAVRDLLLGRRPKDFDLEVHGLDLETTERLLSEFGRVERVGRSFGVLKLAGSNFDVVLPRRDRKVGPGHRGFDISIDPNLGLEEALRRRDLTINAIAYDPLAERILDPLGGLEDLRRGRLRAADERHFAEDPLRGLRVCQFAARFEMEADDALVALCSRLDLSELPPERVFEEWRKMLVLGTRPSLGLRILERSGLLSFFPLLERMRGVPQDPRWHPEGDVWTHTVLCCDAMVAQRCGEAGRDEILGFGVLLHDVGKPATTQVLEDRVISHRHEIEGVRLAASFLEGLRASKRLVRSVATLVRWHLEPVRYVLQGATERAYRRLARRLAEGGVDADLLARLARADLLGRTTDAARRGEAPEVERFLERMRALGVEHEAPPDVVSGRHVLARGFAPGPLVGRILEKCREIQDATGLDDPDSILDRALEELGLRP